MEIDPFKQSTPALSKTDLSALHDAQRGTEPNRHQRRRERAMRRREIGTTTNLRVRSPVEGIEWVRDVHYRIEKSAQGVGIRIIDHSEGVETAIDPKTGNIVSVHKIDVTYDTVQGAI